MKGGIVTVSVASVKRSWENLRTPVRASAVFTAAAVLGKGVAFLSVALFTRMLPPDAFGLYPLYTARQGMLTVFATWQLYGGTLYRRLSRAGAAERDRTVAQSVCLVSLPFFTALAGYGILLLLFPALSADFPPYLTAVLFADIAANTVLSFYYAKCRYTYAAWRYFCVFLAVAVLSPALTLLLLHLTSAGGVCRILAPAAVAVCAAVYAGCRLFAGVGRLPPLRTGVNMLKEGAALLPYALALVSVEEAVRLLVGGRLGAAALAGFGIAFSVGGAPALVSAGLQSAFQPWMLRKLSAGRPTVVRRVLVQMFGAIAALSAAVVLLSPELFSLLAPSAYRFAVPYVLPAALAVPLHVLFLSMTALSLYRGRVKQVTLSSVAAAVVSFFLCDTAVRLFGGMGGAWSVPLSYGLLCLTAYLVLRGGGDGHVVRVPVLLFLYGTVVAVCLAAWRLFPYPYVRWSLCALLLAGLALYAYKVRAQFCEV